MKNTLTPSSNRMTTALWLATPVFTGACIMALELVAFRLYAPYFGYSMYVWGSMISVMMAALAVGYAFGGWLADRSRTDQPLYGIILLSAAYQLVIIYTVHSFLPTLAQSGDFTGVILATLIIFALPISALATVAPFVIRLLARVGSIGVTAGKIYALATVGSVAGVFATSFFLVPSFGTRVTLMTACAATAMTGLAGLFARRRETVFGLIVIAALPFAPDGTWSKGTLWISESAYNLVRVVRDDNRLLLVLNDETSVHTIRDETTGWTNHYYDIFALGPSLIETQPARLLVLGMGAGGSIAATRRSTPDVEVDAVEIDRKVVEAGARFFDLQLADARLRVHIADARPWLMQDRGDYDLVHLDLYQGGPYVPFYLTTVEFFRLVRGRMADDGLLMMNVFDINPKRELLHATAATLRRVFPSLLVLSTSHGNHLVLAFTREGRTAASVRAQLERLKHRKDIEQLAHKAAASVADLVPPHETTVFTDDYAPVEEMTRRMLADYRDKAF